MYKHDTLNTGEKKRYRRNTENENTNLVQKNNNSKIQIYNNNNKFEAFMNNRMYEGKKIESKGVFSFDANDYLVC